MLSAHISFLQRTYMFLKRMHLTHKRQHMHKSTNFEVIWKVRKNRKYLEKPLLTLTNGHKRYIKKIFYLPKKCVPKSKAERTR
jgi:hypothetical protein